MADKTFGPVLFFQCPCFHYTSLEFSVKIKNRDIIDTGRKGADEKK
jgi:hypothetical protein